MGRTDVWRALQAVDEDDDVRERVAAGDFDALDDVELSAEEQLLVRDAASDMPEVSGFTADLFSQFHDSKDFVISDKELAVNAALSQLPGPWQTALRYAYKQH